MPVIIHITPLADKLISYKHYLLVTPPTGAVRLPL